MTSANKSKPENSLADPEVSETDALASAVSFHKALLAALTESKKRTQKREANKREKR